jgi:hypothetical protein
MSSQSEAQPNRLPNQALPFDSLCSIISQRFTSTFLE